MSLASCKPLILVVQFGACSVKESAGHLSRVLKIGNRTRYRRLPGFRVISLQRASGSKSRRRSSQDITSNGRATIRSAPGRWCRNASNCLFPDDAFTTIVSVRKDSFVMKSFKLSVTRRSPFAAMAAVSTPASSASCIASCSRPLRIKYGSSSSGSYLAMLLTAST